MATSVVARTALNAILVANLLLCLVGVPPNPVTKPGSPENWTKAWELPRAHPEGLKHPPVIIANNVRSLQSQQQSPSTPLATSSKLGDASAAAATWQQHLVAAAAIFITHPTGTAHRKLLRGTETEVYGGTDGSAATNHNSGKSLSPRRASLLTVMVTGRSANAQDPSDKNPSGGASRNNNSTLISTDPLVTVKAASPSPFPATSAALQGAQDPDCYIDLNGTAVECTMSANAGLIAFFAAPLVIFFALVCYVIAHCCRSRTPRPNGGQAGVNVPSDTPPPHSEAGTGDTAAVQCCCIGGDHGGHGEVSGMGGNGDGGGGDGGGGGGGGGGDGGGGGC